MQETNIGEVRGVADSNQNLEGNMVEIADDKMNELPGADRYRKASADMKLLTEIEKKTKNNEQLTKEELQFFYEIDSTIEGFGYKRDPRIEELRSQRDKEEDMLTVFDCSKDQIAHNTNEINENTKAYIGEWNSTIFQTIKNYPNIKHFYESFPESKIFMQTLETDPTINSPKKAEEALKAKNIYLSDWGKDILSKTKFSKKAQTYELVQFTVEQLGLHDGATTDEIYKKAEEADLDLCPAEVGPHLRLVYKGKDWKFIAMKQILGCDGDPNVFSLDAGDAELRLHGHWADSGDRWYADFRFIFLSRKLES